MKPRTELKGLVLAGQQLLLEIVKAMDRGDVAGVRVKAQELRGVAETIRRMGDASTELLTRGGDLVPEKQRTALTFREAKRP